MAELRPPLPTAFVSVLLILLFALAAPAYSANHKLDKALQDGRSNGQTGPVQVIITTTNPDGVRAKLTAKHKKIVADHPAIHAITTVVDSSDLDDLERDPTVVSVSVDAVVKSHQSASDGSDAIVGLDQLRSIVGSSMTGLTGNGVGVAIIDSGFANIADIHDQIDAFYDFRGGTAKAAAPADEYGHGTHIAATIGSSGKQNEYQFQGIAPKARLIGLRVLGKDGTGLTSNVINAIAFATAQKDALGIDIINLSLGHPIYESVATDPLVQAVERAVHAGIVVFVSAGNFGINPVTGERGYGGIASPGNAPSAITVGATNTSGTLNRFDDVVAPYSSSGPSWFDGFAKPDLVAPGHRLVADTNKSTLYNKYTAWRFAPLPGWSGQYVRLSGSSMATAVASGIAALVIEANRTAPTPMAPLNPYAVKTILEYSATPLAGVDPLTQGAGEINAAGAVALTRALDTNSTPPVIAPLELSTTFGSEVEAWSASLIWGAVQLQNLTPDAAIDGANIVWGDNIVWGNSLLMSDTASIIAAACALEACQ